MSKNRTLFIVVATDIHKIPDVHAINVALTNTGTMRRDMATGTVETTRLMSGLVDIGRTAIDLDSVLDDRELDNMIDALKRLRSSRDSDAAELASDRRNRVTT